MATLEMQASLRPSTGAGSSRNLIRSGKIPAIIYGNKQPNISLALEEKEITKLLKSGALTSTLIELKLDGAVHKAIVKQIQIDPVKDTARHVDLMFLHPTEQKVDVPITFEGKEKCLGVKRGGFFNIIHRKLKLLCDPNKIPSKVSIDVLEMRIGEKVIAGKIALPEGSKLAVNDNAIIATITGRGKGAEEAKEAPAK
jgi:large subunit ribosomal protein L25